MMTWVAGQLPEKPEIPHTGIATYGGHVGPGGPANEMGGNVLVFGGPNYLASGIFAASKK